MNVKEYDVEDFDAIANESIGSPALRKHQEDTTEEMTEGNLNSYIREKVENAVIKGLRGKHTGKEILQILKKERLSLLKETSKDITSVMVKTILEKKKNAESTSFFTLDDFISIVGIRSAKKEQRDKALAYLIVENKGLVSKKQGELKRDSEEENLSGVEAISAEFFDIFDEDNRIYGYLKLSPPEQMMEIKI